ncbi:MAG: hypothetical protein RL095_439 [Verrucomicrobiota bacterium]
MEFLTLHLLTSYPVSCLNRDDMGSPKSARIGGVNRARISSQAQKSQIRAALKTEMPEFFGGIRSPQIERLLSEEALRQGENLASAKELAKTIFSELKGGSKTQKAKSKGKGKSKNAEDDVEEEATEGEGGKAPNLMMFFSPLELRDLVTAARQKQKLARFIASYDASQALAAAVDIALFGRFLAAASELTLEGACGFTHSLSTHEVEEELDYFAAIDDCRQVANGSAVVLGTNSYQSATYYQCVTVNLDLLARHLSDLGRGQRLQLLECFLRVVLTSNPQARKGGMFAANPPYFVLGIHQKKGHPVQLMNAFEKPVPRSRDGYNSESQRRLVAEHEKIQRTWGAQSREFKIPELTLPEFLDGLLEQVWRDEHE